ncbi:MAG TPA: alkaline phosphatase, partial [Marinobacter sp.]|nr:alkaline phosphatase [Marinobacter sp.]
MYYVKLNKLLQAMMLSAPLILAGCSDDDDSSGPLGSDTRALNFVRVATLPVCTQINADCDTDTETAAEIVDVSEDGKTLIYTDSPRGVIGFVDITTPDAPAPLGTLDLAGEPTSVAVKGRYALVGVNTSASLADPSGKLAVVDIASRTLVTTIDLNGQPDSVAVSPDKAYAAIAIENERDEDVDDGRIDLSPQLPAGYLVVADISAADPAAWTTRDVELTGLASIAPTDPEPEYVDINSDNMAVVTLQENNHLVLVDLATASVTDHFSAGEVSLGQVDTVEEDIISQTGSLSNIVREPDGVTWIDSNHFVTADEGDMNGG